MRSRLKYGSALAAAALALACGAPGASALTFGGSNSGTFAYNAQTVALNTPAFSAAIPSFALHYFSSTGQGSAGGGGTFTVTWTTTGTGTAFAGALTAANVTIFGGIGACNGAVAAAPVISTSTVSVGFTGIGVGGTGFGCTVGLVSNTPLATVGAPALSVTGLNNLAPVSGSAAGTSNGTPTAVFGTFNTTTFQGAGTAAEPQLQDIITVAVTADNGVAGHIDSNPQIAAQLTSFNGWFITTPFGPGALVDLTGAGAPAIPPGMGFQRVANGVYSVTNSAALGTITINNINGLLDARFANACCTNSANTFGGNTPLPGIVYNLNVVADLQTITQAYLRPGNNLAGNNVNPTVNGATPNVEQNPNPNSFASACTGTTGGSDIVSSPAPTAAGFKSASFVIPGSTNSVTNLAFTNTLTINQVQYAFCVVTNGTNVIADTGANSPGIAGQGGGNFSGASTTLSAVVPGIATPISILANAKLGWDIAYGGQKLVFPNVFNSSTGRPSSFRLVNTGMGTFPVYALLQKDGGSPALVAGGSFAAMTPFSAFYVKADDIVGGPGNLGLNNTITLLTPAPAGSLLISHFLNDPNGDIVLVGPGL